MQLDLPAKTRLRPDPQARFIVACAALAGFVYQFESNLVNVALPTIAVELGLTTTQASLIPIVYLLGATLALVPAGRLGWRFGLKRVLLGAVVLMTLGTALCGLSNGLPMLLGGRLAQGMGAGGMAALGYAIIAARLPATLVGYGYGRLSMAAGLGMLAGNPAGGLLAQFLGWQAIFLASIPGMLALLLVARRWLPNDPPTGRDGREGLGLLDSLLLGLGAAGAILFLSFGHECGFTSPAMLGALGACLILLAVLGIRARQGRLAFLPPRLLGNHRFRIALVALIVFIGTVSGTSFLMPFYLETVCGLSPSQSSLLMLANAAAYTCIAPFAGGLADRGRAIGLLILAAASGIGLFGLFTSVLIGAQWVSALLFLVGIGIANGLYTSPLNKIALSTVPSDLKQQAAVFLPLAVIVGSALGVSIFETLYSHGLAVAAGLVAIASGAPSGAASAFRVPFATGALMWSMAMLCVLSIWRSAARERGYEPQ